MVSKHISLLRYNHLKFIRITCWNIPCWQFLGLLGTYFDNIRIICFFYDFGCLYCLIIRGVWMNGKSVEWSSNGLFQGCKLSLRALAQIIDIFRRNFLYALWNFQLGVLYSCIIIIIIIILHSLLGSIVQFRSWPPHYITY